MAKRHSEVNFELNLVPFIDMLSTCIMFLLVSVTWIQLGAMKVKQSVGGQAATGPRPAALWTFIQDNGAVVLQLEDAPAETAKKIGKLTIDGIDGKPDVKAVMAQVADIRAALPTLSTALIQPKPQTNYEDVIELMDGYRKEGIADLGISPL